jgi:MOSC domain-containing protein YiiM
MGSEYYYMTYLNAKLMNLTVGLPTTMGYHNGKEMKTGIFKEPIEESFLSKEGFLGDGVANVRFHGGPDRAVCVYPFEHYGLWEKEFGPLPHAVFGENLSVTNMLERDVHIGDVYHVGEAVIQITQPGFRATL